jgi:multiple sugar transport system substrate-binding protein
MTARRAAGLWLGLALAIGAWGSAPAVAATELVVQYGQPAIFDPVFTRLKEQFERAHPDVKVVYRAPHKDYGAAIQSLLREATVGGLPHIDYVGLSFTRVVADRGLAVDLAPLMAADKSTFEAGGWSKALQGLGQVDGKQIALPFAVSSSIVYYNADLVRRVGGDPDTMPRDWDGILALAGKVRALGPEFAGMYIPYTSAWYGAWYFQGIVYGAGGEIMRPEAKTVALDEPAGRFAIEVQADGQDHVDGPPVSRQRQTQDFHLGASGPPRRQVGAPESTTSR